MEEAASPGALTASKLAVVAAVSIVAIWAPMIERVIVRSRSRSAGTGSASPNS